MARSRADLKPVDQLGMDERTIVDDVLEQALEKRTRALDDIAEIRPLLKSANEVVKERVAVHEVAPGSPVRVGRFRVTKTIIPGGTGVSFTTAERSQVNVKIVGEE